MEPIEDTVPTVFFPRHYAFAFFVFCIWSFLLFKEDHKLGCPASHGIMYNVYLHWMTLILYMVSHAKIIHTLERINKPTLFSLSKMGNVNVTLRKLKFFLVFRVFIIGIWLTIVFLENAEENYIPVIFLIIHFCIVLGTILLILWSVRTDNSKLHNNDRMVLGNTFYISAFVELSVSILWVIFNVMDVYYCHEWYGFSFS